MMYNLIIEAFTNFPDINNFPAEEAFEHFDTDDPLIDDVLYLDEIEKVHPYYMGVLESILNTWERKYRNTRAFTQLPQKLWRGLMDLPSIQDDNSTPTQESIRQIEDILANRKSKQSICLDLLRQMISTNKLYNQLSCIKNIILPNLERECYYIQDEKHPQIQMRAPLLKNAMLLRDGRSPNLESIISSVKNKEAMASQFSEWYD